MIKNTLKAVNDYAEAYRQAKQVYKQAIKHIKANYKEGSELYKSAMKTAEKTLNEAIKPIKNTCVKQVQEDFEEVRKAIRKAVTEPPTADIMTMLPMIREGKLNETEIQMVMEQHKGNYMDIKLLSDAQGKHFTTVEGVMEDLDALEDVLTKYFENYCAGSDQELNIPIRNTDGKTYTEGGYMARLLQHGDWINRIDTLTDDFVSLYSVQGFDNKE